MESTGRIFKCVRCIKQVIICRRCDRGQRYCSPDCSKTARIIHNARHSHRYQQSREGRLKHARRMRHYRRRKQIVTHQGSQSISPNGLLQANSADARKSSVTPDQPVVTKSFNATFAVAIVRNLYVWIFFSVAGFIYHQPIRPKRKPK